MDARESEAACHFCIETVAVQVIEQSAPGVMTVTEVEETRQAS